ncbi:MAG: hypothetical protein M0P71_00845 [Melioribacteraceae bacterium]|nr:hypothetical protein [Melioribacteraceae bacterium]
MEPEDDGLPHKRVDEYILCAAIHFDDEKVYVHQPFNIKTGFVVCGRRHHNCFMTMAILDSNRLNGNRYKREIQGFITSSDRFVDRREGNEIARKRKQVDNDYDEQLMSEDLY